MISPLILITAEERTQNFSYVVFDRICSCLLAIDTSHKKIFQSFDSGDTWMLLAESPRTLRSVTMRAQRLIAITDFDGVITRPIAPAHATSSTISSSFR